MVTTAVDALESSAACKPVILVIVEPPPPPLETVSSFALSIADNRPSVVEVATGIT